MTVIEVQREGFKTLYINANSVNDFYYDPEEDKTYVQESGSIPPIVIKGNHVLAILSCFDERLHIEPGFHYYKTEMRG